MELKRDDIVKALECCTTKNGNVKNCGECPLKDEQCTVALPQNALSLINELTEEKDRYKRYYFNHCFDELRANVEANVRADTLRELKNRLTREVGTYLSISIIKVADMFKLIDQIAEEMIGGADDKKD